MTAPVKAAREVIPPLDLNTALRTYQQHLADMTEEQLTEERHRLEAQLPYGEAHRLANAEFDRRHPLAQKQRLFIFSGGSPARVTCKHCGWASQGRGDAQKVFDRSNGHECAGVESYAAMLARHEAEQVSR